MPDADIWVAPGVTAFTAPPGTPLTDNAAWKQIAGVKGASFVNGRIEYDKVTRDWMAANYVFPQRFITGIDPSKWDASIINERSKPMGLTKAHKYTDNDGDTLSIADNNEDEQAIAWIDRLSGNCGFNVTAEDSIPLALNVLGFDRPSSELHAAGSTTYNGRTANTPIPSAQEQRDANVALAIDYLRGADIFDQRADERRAAEEAKKVAKAKLDEAYSHVKERMMTVVDHGISPVSLKTVTAAIDEYNAAIAGFRSAS